MTLRQSDTVSSTGDRRRERATARQDAGYPASLDREYAARSRGGVLTRFRYAVTDTLKAIARGT
jgi:hypothetical protein